MKKETQPKPVKDKNPKDGKVTTQDKPFPVPPSGCPDGYYDNGSGQCILDS